MIEQIYITERIINHLMLNVSKITDLGLMHGKMGIIIFLNHYSCYMDKYIYKDIADELLDDIFERININIPIDFESGISGIGWGIEYLLENNFVEGDSNFILEEIDKKITQFDIRRFDDISIKTGIEGVSYYVSKRIKSSMVNRKSGPFDELYLSEWEFVYNRPLPSDKQILYNIIGSLPTENNIASWKLGLTNGCAGWLLKKIL